MDVETKTTVTLILSAEEAEWIKWACDEALNEDMPDEQRDFYSDLMHMLPL